MDEERKTGTPTEDTKNGDKKRESTYDTDTEIFAELYDVIEDRRDNPSESSYTSSLLTHEKGENAVLEKIGEETTEVMLASKDDDRDDTVAESADLIYHLFVLLASKGIELEDLADELEERRG